MFEPLGQTLDVEKPASYYRALVGHPLRSEIQIQVFLNPLKITSETLRTSFTMKANNPYAPNRELSNILSIPNSVTNLGKLDFLYPS